MAGERNLESDKNVNRERLRRDNLSR